MLQNYLIGVSVILHYDFLTSTQLPLFPTFPRSQALSFIWAVSKSATETRGRGSGKWGREM